MKNRLPEVIVFAGPNGSGKTTITRMAKTIGIYINADDIKKLNEKEEPVVFILWGNFAKSKIKYITNTKHLVLSSSHPSPFSVNQGFLGSKPFSKAKISVSLLVTTSLSSHV